MFSRQMIDPNTRTDYGKMKKLLEFDKLDGERKGHYPQDSRRGADCYPAL